LADFVVGFLFGYVTILLGDNLWFADDDNYQTLIPVKIYPFYQFRNWDKLKEEAQVLPEIAARAVFYVILLVVYIWELGVSTLVVVWYVLRFRTKIKPGIVALPLQCDRQFEIVLLNALITMSPGTLGVDVDREAGHSNGKGFLFVHCLHIPDRQQKIDELEFLQRLLLDATQGPRRNNSRKELT
jgi:multicomponent Na+:H+ antiporter subunit E